MHHLLFSIYLPFPMGEESGEEVLLRSHAQR
jgi:hypothetical protein